MQRQRRTHFNGREWFDKKVEKNTERALQIKNRDFAAEHATDSHLELIDYLKKCAKELGHTPNRNEVIGGRFIAGRFDGWENALLKAGLSLSLKRLDKKKTRLYQDEYKFQTELLETKLRECKEQKLEEQLKKQKLQSEGKKELLMEESVWMKEHQNDSDESLIEYVRQCAKTLGYTPYRRDVLGSKYIAERCGGWYEVLTLAGLPIPKDMKPLSKKKKKQLRKRHL